MNGELPVFKRCCFCLPLRRGLVGWGYIRLALDVLTMIRILVICIYLSSFPLYYYDDYEDVIECYSVAGYYFIDAIFALFLIVGGHKKSHKLLRLSYIYCIVWLALFLILGVFLVCRDIFWMHKRENINLKSLAETGMILGMGFAIIFVQVYLLLLMRSEEIKLRKENLRVVFVNNAADAESTGVCADQ